MSKLAIFFYGAAFGAIVSNYIGYRLGYNLYDWLKDHILALFGLPRA